MATNYFKYLNNGNLYTNILPLFLPFSLWVLLIYMFYAPYIRHNHNGLSSQIVLILIICLPFFMALQPIISNYKRIFADKAYPPSMWPPCTTFKNMSKGIIGTYNYKCGSSQITSTLASARDVVSRFFYVNYALFLIILVFKQNLKTLNKYHVIFLSLTLLLGAYGNLAPIFAISYQRSLVFQQMSGVLINMNLSAFLFAIVTLFSL